MYTISTNGSSQIIINHIKYILNEQQYIDMGRLERCRSMNIGQPVPCHNPLWEIRTRGTTPISVIFLLVPPTASAMDAKYQFLTETGTAKQTDKIQYIAHKSNNVFI